MSDLLAQADDEAGTLREQLTDARVVSSCTCGCGSIGFVPVGYSAHRDRREATLFPVEGDVLDDQGQVVGGLILFVREGRMHDLEVYSFDDEPLPLPDLAHVRWKKVNQ